MKLYFPLLPGERLDYENTKPTYVVEDLSELASETNGVVELPVELDWTPCNKYDLSNRDEKMRMYEVVLAEAHSENDVRRYINADDLHGFWEKLRLPRRVRYAWESVHPRLYLRQ